MSKSEAVRRNPWALAVLVALAVVLPGCGSDNSSGPNGNDVISDTQNVPVLSASFLQFTAQRNGSVDADVNWNNGNNDIDIYATLASCPNLDSLLGGACQILALEESATLKPERFTFSVSNGTAYRVWALNLGPGNETVTIRLTAR